MLSNQIAGKAVQIRPVPSEIETTDGRLWFATAAGVFQIDPAHLLRNALVPSVEIRIALGYIHELDIEERQANVVSNQQFAVDAIRGLKRRDASPYRID